ncbi:mechanosensitive ion channel family protein [Tenacibaculum agarivorans]|uniref:mechanosensitive ion channel family protein n=1 Tax=Tenacibaculum agarivorans TaxID=1908389 RepID=UPI00094BB395|nr:mechanosensitive ion channel domain-containing protein [Tenacibaculum agarivorans]
MFINLSIVLGFFIILFLLVGVVVRKRTAKNKPVVAPKIMRYLVLPTGFIYSICLFVFELSRSHIPVKITETILIIFGISFLIQTMNHLLFSEDNVFTKKEAIPKLRRDMIQFLLVLVSSAFVFSAIWEFDLRHLLTALGVGSFVLSLELLEPLGNLFNGIALLIAKTFEKGDWVEIGGDTGKIVDMNWRSVKILNRFNELIIIPNNTVRKERIKNLSRPSKIHAESIEIGFSYKNNPKKVKKVLVDTCTKINGILKKHLL